MAAKIQNVFYTKSLWMKIEIKQIVGLWSHSLAIYPLGDSHISYTPALKKNSRILENSLK